MATLQCFSSLGFRKQFTIVNNRRSSSSSSSLLQANPNTTTTTFRSLSFCSNLSETTFSIGSLSLKKKTIERRPNRPSFVCDATATTTPTTKKKVDSAVKRALQSEKRRIYHKAKKSEMRTRMKKVLVALAKLRKKKDAESTEVIEIEKLIAEAYSAIDKAVRSGSLHKNTGSHRKSRLARRKQAIEIHHGWYTPSAAADVVAILSA